MPFHSCTAACARASYLNGADCRVEVGRFRAGKLHLRSGHIVAQVLEICRAGNRHDVIALRHQPCQRDLSGRSAFALCPLPGDLDQRQIGLAVIRIHSRSFCAEIVRRKSRRHFDRSGQKPVAERREWDETDA